jgi:hypothetical protein
MTNRLFLKGAAMAALVCLIVWPLAMRAQRRSPSAWEAQVRGKLAAASLLLRFVDAHLTYDPYIGSLDEDDYFDVRVTLRKGVRYMLLGVCDDDCANLNMKLCDEQGNYVGKHTAPGSTADLEIIPEQTQKFHVLMIMKECDDEPCYYGLGVYNN